MHSFNQTTVNVWKNKFNDGTSNVVFKKAGDLTLLLDEKIKNIAIGRE